MEVSKFVILILACGLSDGGYPFRDPTLPWDDRVDDLLSHLTLEEIVGQSMALYKHPTPAIPRLGIAPYVWITECLVGQVLTNGTAFPQSIGIAATFSRDIVESMAEAISTEVRARWNWRSSRGEYVVREGLSCFSPVINMLRHPLWGRNQETYGEDPYLTSQLAQHYVQGLQGSDARIVRTNAGCKHFDVHGGPENIPVSRMSFDAKVSKRDWHMTFLPAFKACVKAGTLSVMCSYNSINGVPSCANKELLTDILRDQWGFQGYVVSDSRAIYSIQHSHHYRPNDTSTVAAAIQAGCNLELTGASTGLYNSSLPAIQEGLLSETEVRNNLRSALYVRMRLGEFDPVELNPYAKLDMSVVQSKKHRELSITAAAKSFVLLKTTDYVLPIKQKVKKIAIVGPFANSNLQQLYGSYAPNFNSKYAKTPFEALSVLGDNAVTEAGCQDGPKCESYDSKKLEAAVFKAEIVIVCIGTGARLESEGNDRSFLDLPGHQLKLLQDAANRGGTYHSRIIVLTFSAGPLDLTWPLNAPTVAAMIHCFFPSQATGYALYRTLTGSGDGGVPAGRLPMTWPAYLDQVPPITNYSMDGHTYRYYHGEPLFSFGYGLSYSKFLYKNIIMPSTVIAGKNFTVNVWLQNVGSYDAEEVVQVYVSWLTPNLPSPRLQLVAFDRIFIRQKVEPTHVSFNVSTEQMALWIKDEQGFIIPPGEMMLYVGGQQPGQQRQARSNILQQTFTIQS